MVLRLLIDAVHPSETRVAIVDNGRINDFDFVTSAKKQLKGNIYLAKITRVEPSLQAAFVEYGSGKQGFLPFAEIHPDYYQIPVADRERLLKEAEEAEDHAHDAHEDVATHQPIEAKTQAEPEPEEVFLRAEQKIISDLHDTHAPTNHVQPAAEEIVPLPANVTEESVPNLQLVSDKAENPPADIAIPEKSADVHAEHTESHQAEASHEVETLANEEDAVRQSRPRSFSRRYKIQEVIKRNQIVLVQVIKEERGNKGVSLTTFMSLAGRYCVLMPNSPKGGGISRKISSGEDRRRLKEISSELKTARGMSAIIRTAGIDRSRAEIQRDYEYLVKLWETIREKTLASTAPALIYEEGDLINRTIRDLYSTDIEEIIVAGEEGLNQAKNFLEMILPGHDAKIRPHTDNIPLFHAYSIEDQLTSMYDQNVKLRSGGYIVLNPTEALISIDVNSGRSTGERNIEETATKTNLEAAYEIARQLRLRDLAGLIVIDFIDMADSRNRRNIERALRDALKLDRAKIQIGRISPFGLMEMSRQRLRPSLSETSSMTCPHCQGKGVVRSGSSIALQIVRALEKEAASGAAEIKVYLTPEVALDMLNTRRDAITSIEAKYSIRVSALIDDNLLHGSFRIEKVKSQRKGSQSSNLQTPVSMNNTAIMEGIPNPEEQYVVHSEDSVEAAPAQAHSNEDGAPPSMPVYSDDRPRRSRRGNRGRRNNNNNRNYNEPRTKEAGASADGVATEPSEGSNVNAPVRENREPREPREPREGRSDRPHRRRSRNWRDKRDQNRNHEGNNTNGGQGNSGHGSESAPQQNHQPAAARTHHSENPSTSSIPSLQDQAPQDGKPKKGWWRRIVEA